MKQKTNLMITNQKGFTLIEIIAVLVILGLLAVVAVPKYIDLQAQAAQKSADGVWGAANSAVSLNFANGILNPAGSTPIATAADLVGAMESTPQGWTASGTTLTDSSGTYVITITAAEVEGSTRAVLTKSW